MPVLKLLHLPVENIYPVTGGVASLRIPKKRIYTNPRLDPSFPYHLGS